MSQPIEILLVVAAVGFVIVRRLLGEPLRARPLLVLPVVLGAVGIASLHQHVHQVRVGDAVAFGLGLALSLAVGLVRGRTIAVFVRDGHLWMRYRPVTLLVWVVGAAAREAIALTIGGPLVSHGLLLMFGVSLAGEAAVVALRSQSFDAPFAPDRRSVPLRG